MRTLLCDPPPPGFDALLDERRRHGQDRHDEVWDGVLHVNPSPHSDHAELQSQMGEILGPSARAAGLKATGEFNLGEIRNFRVPDAGMIRGSQRGLYLDTAALVVEILSPHDETWEKLPFYAARAVDEVLIVDPEAQAVHWLGLRDGEYFPIEHSGLIELGPAGLAQRLDWPG